MSLFPSVHTVHEIHSLKNTRLESIFIMISQQVTTFFPLLLPALTAAFSLPPGRQQRLCVLDMANVGIFFGTSTGTTEDVGDLIKEVFGDDADGPFDIDGLEGSVEEIFAKYDGLIVGTPTWNTGAPSSSQEAQH